MHHTWIKKLFHMKIINLSINHNIPLFCIYFYSVIAEKLSDKKLSWWLHTKRGPSAESRFTLNQPFLESQILLLTLLNLNYIISRVPIPNIGTLPHPASDTFLHPASGKKKKKIGTLVFWDSSLSIRRSNPTQ